MKEMQSIRASASLDPAQDGLTTRGRPRWLLWVIAVLVLVGIGVGGFIYFRQTRPTRPNFTTVPAVKGRPEDVQSATAVVAAAKARLHELQLGPQSGDVAVARSAVQLAQATLTASQSNLARVTRPADPTAIQQAQAALAQAESFVW